MAVEVRATHYAPVTARRMAETVSRFVASLTPRQRAAACFPFEGTERFVWHYTPSLRNGLRLLNMTHEQQELCLAVFDVGLSAAGAKTARQIIALEGILREQERREHWVNIWSRDPELYWVSVFGQPGSGQPWGWRFGGHHLCLHFTVIAEQQVACLPLFFGANPSEVRVGEHAGQRTLPQEEDLARALFKSLTPEQRTKALLYPTAPLDHLTTNLPRVHPTMLPPGIAMSALGGQQREMLARLIRLFVDRVAGELAENEWRGIERAGLDHAAFAWAGGEEPGQGHYYNIKGASFMVEYDNIQNDANHIHTVWRDWTNDWGEDLLARHYAESHSR